MKKIEVVAAIILKDDKIFVTQRGYGEFKGGWEFPGGKIEAGEEKESALEREILEELNTKIKVDKFLCTVEHQYESFFMTMHCYICSIESGNLELNEHEDSRWLTKDNLSSVNFLEADIEVVERLKEYLNTLN